MATKQVPPMDFTGNIGENWARWKELVLAGPSANKWTETQKAAQFLICIGQQGRNMAQALVSSSELPEDDKKVLQSCSPFLKRIAHQKRTLPFRENFSTKGSNHRERRLMNGSRSCA